MTKLSKLASGDVRTGQFFESTDLDAAKALAKFGIDALKLAKAGAATDQKKKDDQKDLFDLANANPWKLKEID